MKTTKPISTISYNSLAFLQGKLDDMLDKGFIDFYAFIHHEPEEDEEKDHWHVYCEPCCQLDTLWFKKQFAELDPTKPLLPLGTLKWQKSNFYDWYWYGLHDVNYLASKCQTRKIHYTSADVIASDDLQLLEYIRTNPLKQSQLALIRDMLQAGWDVSQIAMSLNIKAQQMGFFLQGVSIIADMSITNRHGRPNHEVIENGDSEDENR